jgi:predicted amidohydrolase YtcJ
VTNATIYTVDKAFDLATTMAVSGKIIAVAAMMKLETTLKLTT